MMPDRKWCHDIMRHARHGDASQKHSPRRNESQGNQSEKTLHTKCANDFLARFAKRTSHGPALLRRLHSRRPAAAMIACPQREKTDKTGSRLSPSSEDVADASNQPHSHALQVEKQATTGGRCDCLARFARFTKRATPGPALLAFLPLRRQTAANLQEHPATLRLDEVALLALHLELLLPPVVL